LPAKRRQPDSNVDPAGNCAPCTSYNIRRLTVEINRNSGEKKILIMRGQEGYECCQCCQYPVSISSFQLANGNWKLATIPHWQHWMTILSGFSGFRDFGSSPRVIGARRGRACPGCRENRSAAAMPPHEIPERNSAKGGAEAPPSENPKSRPRRRRAECGRPTALSLVEAGRRVLAAVAGGGGAAPDALAAAVPVAVEAVRAVLAAVAVGRAAAPFAVLLVVDVLVEMVGSVLAAVAVGRAIAVSAFRAHGVGSLGVGG
jgi:hypothetical protein